MPTASTLTRPAPPTHALLVEGLRKYYGDVRAVDGLDLSVAPGECFGLLGPNGAGKTTTIEICEGLLAPDAGRVELLGLRWERPTSVSCGERLGIQLQETQLAEKLTVEETVRLFRSFYARGRTVDDVIALVQLDEKRDARVGKLSGGQKQRLALACAIVGDPELLFLDEPTTGLDPQSRRQLWDLITEFKALGRTILLTTHYMDEAEILCDRVAIVDHGKVIALGTPAELIGRLGAEHVVEFALATESPSGLDDAALKTLDGVRAVRDGRRRIRAAGGRAPPNRARAARAARAVDISSWRTSRRTRRRSRTCSCRSPGGSCAMSSAAHDPGSRIESGRGLDGNSLWQLVTVRFKEYTREPEALFWSFGFPILLAIGLGIAFRSKPADVVHVAVVSGSPRAAGLAEALARDKGLAVETLGRDSASAALRTGRVALVVVPDSAGANGVRYEYDDTRPDARTARLMANDAVQRGAGRGDVLTARDQHVRERGSRYIDFVIPGLLGMTIMGGGIWGLGFSIVDQRRKNLLKRLVATPMSRARVSRVVRDLAARAC